MSATPARKCLCCQEKFHPDARNRRHQQYCSKDNCRKASKAARQARWLAKPENCGYLPIDQRGADLLFQVISARYERGSIILTTNKAFKQWPTIFNGDSTITAAVLDRLLHHGHTVVLEGSSYRMKDRPES